MKNIRKFLSIILLAVFANNVSFAMHQQFNQEQFDLDTDFNQNRQEKQYNEINVVFLNTLNGATRIFDRAEQVRSGAINDNLNPEVLLQLYTEEIGKDVYAQIDPTKIRRVCIRKISNVLIKYLHFYKDIYQEAFDNITSINIKTQQDPISQFIKILFKYEKKNKISKPSFKQIKSDIVIHTASLSKILADDQWAFNDFEFKGFKHDHNYANDQEGHFFAFHQNNVPSNDIHVQNFDTKNVKIDGEQNINVKNFNKNVYKKTVYLKQPASPLKTGLGVLLAGEVILLVLDLANGGKPNFIGFYEQGAALGISLISGLMKKCFSKQKDEDSESYEEGESDDYSQNSEDSVSNENSAGHIEEISVSEEEN